MPDLDGERACMRVCLCVCVARRGRSTWTDTEGPWGGLEGEGRKSGEETGVGNRRFILPRLCGRGAAPLLSITHLAEAPKAPLPQADLSAGLSQLPLQQALGGWKPPGGPVMGSLMLSDRPHPTPAPSLKRKQGASAAVAPRDPREVTPGAVVLAQPWAGSWALRGSGGGAGRGGAAHCRTARKQDAPEGRSAPASGGVPAPELAPSGRLGTAW